MLRGNSLVDDLLPPRQLVHSRRPFCLIPFPHQDSVSDPIFMKEVIDLSDSLTDAVMLAFSKIDLKGAPNRGRVSELVKKHAASAFQVGILRFFAALLFFAACIDVVTFVACTEAH